MLRLRVRVLKVFVDKPLIWWMFSYVDIELGVLITVMGDFILVIGLLKVLLWGFAFRL